MQTFRVEENFGIDMKKQQHFLDTARIFLSSLPIHGGLVGLGLGICEWVVVFGVWGTRISGLRWGISGGGGLGFRGLGSGVGISWFFGFGGAANTNLFRDLSFFSRRRCLLARPSVRASLPTGSSVRGLGVGEPPK